MKKYMNAQEVSKIFGKTTEELKEESRELARQHLQQFINDNEELFVKALERKTKDSKWTSFNWKRPESVDTPYYSAYVDVLYAGLIRHYELRGFKAEFTRHGFYVTWG